MSAALLCTLVAVRSVVPNYAAYSNLPPKLAVAAAELAASRGQGLPESSAIPTQVRDEAETAAISPLRPAAAAAVQFPGLGGDIQAVRRQYSELLKRPLLGSGMVVPTRKVVRAQQPAEAEQSDVNHQPALDGIDPKFARMHDNLPPALQRRAAMLAAERAEQQSPGAYQTR